MPWWCEARVSCLARISCLAPVGVDASLLRPVRTSLATHRMPRRHAERASCSNSVRRPTVVGIVTVIRWHLFRPPGPLVIEHEQRKATSPTRHDCGDAPDGVAMHGFPPMATSLCARILGAMLKMRAAHTSPPDDRPPLPAGVTVTGLAESPRRRRTPDESCQRCRSHPAGERPGRNPTGQTAVSTQTPTLENAHLICGETCCGRRWPLASPLRSVAGCLRPREDEGTLSVNVRRYRRIDHHRCPCADR
jgi:hypothetical protein